MFCGIWYHLYILKNVKNSHGGVLLSVKLQAFTKSCNASRLMCEDVNATDNSQWKF